MKWLLFTNIETDMKNNITRIRCCLADCNFNRIAFIKDYKISDKINVKTSDKINAKISDKINAKTSEKINAKISDKINDNINDNIIFIEKEIVRNLNDNIALKDYIYLVCNLKSSIINDINILSKKMPILEKRIKETIDLSSFCILMETYKLHNDNNNIDYCLSMIYGLDNNFNGINDIKVIF